MLLNPIPIKAFQPKEEEKPPEPNPEPEIEWVPWVNDVMIQKPKHLKKMSPEHLDWLRRRGIRTANQVRETWLAHIQREEVTRKIWEATIQAAASGGAHADQSSAPKGAAPS